MLLYLPEALGVSTELIKKAYDEVIKTNDPKMAKQCGIIRKTIPFELVEKELAKYR
jgi:hypothetical protein